LILLGAFTGSRIEQLCRLRKEHIIEEDGVLSFNFLKGKNEQARRIVPVHPALKAVIERLISDSSDEFLIPATENLYQKRSHGLSREFGKLKEKQGFGPLHVFHSMRNTVITAMLRADVPDYIVQEIVGHTSKSVTHAVYSRGASAQQKLDAISKLPTLTTA
jgi:integrase